MAIPSHFLGSNVPLVMAVSKTIAQGDIVMSLTNTTTLVPGADTANAVFRGIANESKTSGTVAGAAILDVCQEGVFLLTTGHDMSSSVAGVGVYIASATSVDLTAHVTNAILVGYLVRPVSATQAYIRVRAI
jgi:hypothetical protein